jgi:hypothetical protein
MVEIWQHNTLLTSTFCLHNNEKIVRNRSQQTLGRAKSELFIITMPLLLQVSYLVTIETLNQATLQLLLLNGGRPSCKGQNTTHSLSNSTTPY